MLFAACDNRVEVAADMDAPIYPDYANVTIPVNIAPLNLGLLGAQQKGQLPGPDLPLKP